jgi:Sec-independent protein translocase protein TatA
MGFHYIDIAVVVVIGLLIVGPKTFMSMARRAGKSVNQVNSLKEDLLSELPVNELSQVMKPVSKIPTNPLQVAQMLMAPESPEKPQAQEPKKE